MDMEGAMPLAGDRKRDYQREYMRGRRSNKKALDPVLDPKQEKLAELRGLMDAVQSKSS
ncbi:unnamed protein product, partial [marine sediment metagenome]